MVIYSAFSVDLTDGSHLVCHHSVSLPNGPVLASVVRAAAYDFVNSYALAVCGVPVSCYNLLSSHVTWGE